MERVFGSRFLDSVKPMRIVSLVPSLTLTLFDLGLDATSIVGRTPWCIHPEKEVEVIEIVGGTKNPKLKKILALNPDLVVLDREENPKDIHDELIKSGIDVFVSYVESPEDVPDMLRQLGTQVERQKNGDELATALEHRLESLKNHPLPSMRVLPMIWHKPLMSVSPKKYAGALLQSLGVHVPDIEPNGNGYPVVTTEHIIQHAVEGLLLSSEPHEFTLQEGEEIAIQVKKAGGGNVWYTTIDGEALTWFGSHTINGVSHLHEVLQRLSLPMGNESTPSKR